MSSRSSKSSTPRLPPDRVFSTPSFVRLIPDSELLTVCACSEFPEISTMHHQHQQFSHCIPNEITSPESTTPFSKRTPPLLSSQNCQLPVPDETCFPLSQATSVILQPRNHALHPYLGDFKQRLSTETTLPWTHSAKIMLSLPHYIDPIDSSVNKSLLLKLPG